MCCGGGGGQKEKDAPVGGRSARVSRWCAKDRGPRVERQKTNLEFFTETARGRERERDSDGERVGGTFV